MSVISIIGVLATFNGAFAACMGDTPKTHPVQNYDFITNSYFKRCGAYVCFSTCLESKMKEPNHDIYLHWYIPGHTSWLPPGEEETHHRIASDDQHFVADSTCVEYGNNAKTVRAPLIARFREKDAVAKEEGQECARPKFINKVNDKSKIPPPSAMNLPVKRFFPSDWKRPSETMLVLTGQIGIKPTDASFMTYLDYAIDRYPGRKEGDPVDLHLKPRLEQETEFLMPYFLKAYKDGSAPLSTKGTFAFWAPIESPEITSAYFDIVDRGGSVVGTLSLPVFVRRTTLP